SRASSSAPIGPRSVESIFLKKRVRARLRATPATRRAASAGSSPRLSVSTTLTGARSGGSGQTVTGTGPRAANSAPVSQAPVRSSATIVSGSCAAGLIGGSHYRGILARISMPRKAPLVFALFLVVAAIGVALYAPPPPPASQPTPPPPPRPRRDPP